MEYPFVSTLLIFSHFRTHCSSKLYEIQVCVCLLWFYSVSFSILCTHIHMLVWYRWTYSEDYTQICKFNNFSEFRFRKHWPGYSLKLKFDSILKSLKQWRYGIQESEEWKRQASHIVSYQVVNCLAFWHIILHLTIYEVLNTCGCMHNFEEICIKLLSENKRLSQKEKQLYKCATEYHFTMQLSCLDQIFWWFIALDKLIFWMWLLNFFARWRSNLFWSTWSLLCEMFSFSFLLVRFIGKYTAVQSYRFARIYLWITNVINTIELLATVLFYIALHAFTFEGNIYLNIRRIGRTYAPSCIAGYIYYSCN